MTRRMSDEDSVKLITGRDPQDERRRPRQADHRAARRRGGDPRRQRAAVRLVAVYQRPNTSKPAAAHKVYPYLLGGFSIDRVNQVWCSDITYIPMAKGFVYLVVIMDWHSRAVLAWRLSNTLGADFCVEALEEALARFGRPEIFNTDQGSQFTSDDFTGVLSRHGVTISMDGKGRCGAWLVFYNEERQHQSHGYRTPRQVYEAQCRWICGRSLKIVGLDVSPRHRKLVDIALQRAAVQQLAGDIVEP
jgi:transposase InsO family protein